MAHTPPAAALASPADAIDAIDALLPQTQCRQCGHAGCRPYARAIASGDADFNQCPPGGAALIGRLAQLLGRAPKPLNPANGSERPRVLAKIDEARCIGCTLCIQACPVDAIIGAAGYMHTVINDLCSGCELCIAPCPVDCIVTIPAEPLQGAWDAARAAAARERHAQRNARLAREEAEAGTRLAQDAGGGKAAAAKAALARARARKQQSSPP